ncbi:hypothetical protein [Stigmatella aurantiaca]|uniref:Lipoprotein n=1 Tax=Stigmatella aurantiaca (strain DW4/3-1) TaxID=378806 RepID=E3FTU8_STIAD|nr:hypothetical protein [Stigmatella aurantiaca]ADO70900.1 uncharacterized protein STAUR_3108 [Stigmatella aurantiaca DW4/3-1]
MKTGSFFLLAVGALGLILPTNALACGCCSDPGAYTSSMGKPDANSVELLQEMKFDKTAALYMTPGGFDNTKGLSDLEKDFESESWAASPGEFDLANTFVTKAWQFNFKTPTGKSGTLTLPMPAQMSQFKVDIHDGRTGGGGGPLLYKEWRFKGNVTAGTGIFKSSIIQPTAYFLVFQGRGNDCDNAEDFTHWRLEIEGKNAKYTFFGKMSSGSPAQESEIPVPSGYQDTMP